MRLRRKERKVVDVYLALRRQALELTGEDLGQDPTAGLIALLMETGYPEAVVTLASIADGTTSLYFSTGGGVIGAGENEPVAAATHRLLETCAGFMDQLTQAGDEVPLPEEGMTQFVAVTPRGLFTAEAAEDSLGEGGHPLSPVFYAAQDVITQVRLAEETRHPL